MVNREINPNIISTFKEDFKNKLVPGSSYKLLSALFTQYGYELISDSIVSICCPGAKIGLKKKIFFVSIKIYFDREDS